MRGPFLGAAMMAVLRRMFPPDQDRRPKFLRHEIAGMFESRLEHIERQLRRLREETNLDAATRLATLSQLPEDRNPRE